MTSAYGTPCCSRPLDAPLPDERGLLLEHLVASELHRRAGALWPEAALFHYRTRSGAEVDFVLEVEREVWGIEIKASRRVDRRMLSGLSSLSRRSARCTRRIVVFLGTRRQLVDGVEVIPLEEFLQGTAGLTICVAHPRAAHAARRPLPRPACVGLEGGRQRTPPRAPNRTSCRRAVSDVGRGSHRRRVRSVAGSHEGSHRGLT